MCSQMTDVVMRLLWLTQQNQLVLRETPGGIDDHAHRLHLEEVVKIVTTIPVLVTCNNSTYAQASSDARSHDDTLAAELQQKWLHIIYSIRHIRLLQAVRSVLGFTTNNSLKQQVMTAMQRLQTAAIASQQTLTHASSAF